MSRSILTNHNKTANYSVTVDMATTGAWSTRIRLVSKIILISTGSYGCRCQTPPSPL